MVRRGDRVGVARTISAASVLMIGWGVFMGRNASGSVQIRLDNGSEISGDGIWWAEETRMRAILAHKVVSWEGASAAAA